MNPGRWMVFIGLAFLTGPSFLAAQESVPGDSDQPDGTTVQLPVFAETSVNTVVSVPDGGTVIMSGKAWKPDHFGNMIPQSISTAQTLLATPKADLRNRICRSQTWQDGMYFNILHDKRPIEITVRRERIEIETVQEFSAETLDDLADYHPDLAAKLADVPKTSNGQPVVFSIQVPVKREFENLKQLEWTAPELFLIFHEYVDGRVRMPETK